MVTSRDKVKDIWEDGRIKRKRRNGGDKSEKCLQGKTAKKETNKENKTSQNEDSTAEYKG